MKVQKKRTGDHNQNQSKHKPRRKGILITLTMRMFKGLTCQKISQQDTVMKIMSRTKEMKTIIIFKVELGLTRPNWKCQCLEVARSQLRKRKLRILQRGEGKFSSKIWTEVCLMPLWPQNGAKKQTQIWHKVKRRLKTEENVATRADIGEEIEYYSLPYRSYTHNSRIRRR